MNSTLSDNSIIDVLIVGAGPVGLLFANEMHQYGCNFRIIDRNETASTHSKAFLLTSRSMEALEERNLLASFLRSGHIAAGMTFRTARKKLFFLSTASHAVESPFPYTLIIPQILTEKFLEESLHEAAQNEFIVERSVTLVKYEEDERQELVVATLERRTPEGEFVEEIVRAKYIVGCDGVHSAVRKGKPGWTFQGHSFKSSWALADVKVKAGVLKNNEVTNFFHPEGPVAIFPYGGTENRYRIVTSLGDFGYDDNDNVTHGIQDGRHQLGTPAVSQPEFTLDQLSAHVNYRIAPGHLEFYDPNWVTTFRINERMINGYRRGRSFVAGDAAHCHSPAGGQGMNMGLQDAHNLAWKLALVLQGKAKDVELVLDSYSAERAPVAASMLKFTGDLTKVLSTRSRFAHYIRMVIVPYIFKFKSFQNYTRSWMLGSNINYTKTSPLNHPTPTILRQARRRRGWIRYFSSFFFSAPRDLIEPGSHMPDAMLKQLRHDAGHDTLTLYDVLRGTTTHTLIVLSHEGGVKRSANGMVARVMDVAQKYRSTMRVVVVGFVHNINQSDLNDPKEVVTGGVFAELRPELHHRMGVPEGGQAVVVVRPDMYVAFSAVEKEVESGELDKFLDGYFVRDM